MLGLNWLLGPPSDSRITLAGHPGWGIDLKKRFMFRFGRTVRDVIGVSGRHRFANVDHPVSRRYLQATARSWEQWSALERIVSMLVWGNVGTSFNEPADRSSMRTRRLLGTLCGAIEWPSVDATLKPPYRVFRRGAGIYELTDQLLQEWGELRAEATKDGDDERL